LVAAAAAALTVYDMCKALDKALRSVNSFCWKKRRKSGDYLRVVRTTKARMGERELSAHKTCMTPPWPKTVQLLVAEDNPLDSDLIQKGLEPHCDVVLAGDGGDHC